MKAYNFIKPLLFSMPTEAVHHFTLKLLKLAPSGLFHHASYEKSAQTIMGIEFPNPIGLAAGLDKNGEYIDALAKLGFGFIEIGTVTPKAQDGNPKPRLFRLKDDNAIINRMGFNNHGVDALIANVKAANYQGILGINIGKNLTTAVSDAVQDYLYCFEKVYPYASYITVNVSSPNTPGLRDLQQGTLMHDLFSQLRTSQQQLSERSQRYVPMVAKLAPDIDDDSLKQTVTALTDIGVDGFIFSNTTNQRPGLKKPIDEQGGLSGQPLFSLSTQKLSVVKQHTDRPIIGVGGIGSADEAKEKLNQGASLIQIYTGLIYQGPKLINDCLSNI